jgi:hypothetical protein
MSMKNQPLTIEEHRETAEMLTKLWSQLLNAGSTIACRYPRSLQIENDVSAAVAGIDALRNTMSRQAERDLGERVCPSLYHPRLELISA